MLPYFDGERTPNLPKATGLADRLAQRRLPRAARPRCGRGRGVRPARRARRVAARMRRSTLCAWWEAARAALRTARCSPTVRPAGGAGRRRRGGGDRRVRAGGRSRARAVAHREVADGGASASAQPLEASAGDAAGVRARYAELRAATSPIDGMTIDPFAVLGVGPDATLDEVRVGSSAAGRAVPSRSRWRRRRCGESTSPSTRSCRNSLPPVAPAPPAEPTPAPAPAPRRRYPGRAARRAVVHHRRVAGRGLRGAAGRDLVDGRGAGRRSAVRARGAPRTTRSPCWCRLDLVPDAGASTVSLTGRRDRRHPSPRRRARARRVGRQPQPLCECLAPT